MKFFLPRLQFIIYIARDLQSLNPYKLTMLQPPADHTRDFLHFILTSTIYKNLCCPHKITAIQEKYISLVQKQDIVQETKHLAGAAEVEEVRDSWLKLGRLLSNSKHSRRIKENIKAQKSALHTTIVWQI